MSSLFTFVEITSSGVFIHDKEKYWSAMKIQKHGMYKWTLERIYNKRSLRQNNANFGVIYAALQPYLIEALGEYIPIASNNDEDVTVHNICKARCLPKAYVERLKAEHEKSGMYDKNTGELIYKAEFRLTTIKMTTVEMSEYWENIRQWAAEYFNAVLPEPDKEFKSKILKKNENKNYKIVYNKRNAIYFIFL